jgi:hypothetical protein
MTDLTERAREMAIVLMKAGSSVVALRGFPAASRQDYILTILQSVRDEAYERAAQCADRCAEPPASKHGHEAGIIIAATNIASAIRALKGKP